MPRPLNQTDTDLNADNLLRLPAEFGCPVWVYDAQIVREKIAALHQFDVVRFAQKACSNIHILRLMREQGVKVDSVSLAKSSARWRPDSIRKPTATRSSLLPM
jgi:diaminopimelate decarboxylase